MFGFVFIFARFKNNPDRNRPKFPGLVMGRLSGPGRADLRIVTGRAGRAETFENGMGRAGPGRDLSLIHI